MKYCLDCSKQIYKDSIRCRACESNRRRGSNSPVWKGGRWDNGQGYILVKVDGKIVREHRHVMEQHLGRSLLPNENVHHINGNRSDNRIENLELWVVNQPKGQRVDDLVEWAKEILTLYDP